MSTLPKIAFQGEPGANSHIACHEAYADYEPVPCPTFEDAFAAVASGEADLGMIPIENSVAGRVADIHHLMPTSGLHIVAEWFLPVRHQLMAPRGAKLADIRSVESHVMALGQCRAIIRKLGLKVTPSVANFVLIHFPTTRGKTSVEADAYLTKRGLVLRALNNYGLPHALRMTIGTDEANRLVVEALRDFMAGK